MHCLLSRCKDFQLNVGHVKVRVIKEGNYFLKKTFWKRILRKWNAKISVNMH